MEELGIRLQQESAIDTISLLRGRFMPLRSVRVAPIAVFPERGTEQLLEKDFDDVLILPQNFTLKILPDYAVTIVPGTAGERIDMLSLNRDIAHAIVDIPYARVLAGAIRAVPNTDPAQLEALRVYAQKILASGFALVHGDETFIFDTKDIAKWLRFTESSGENITFDEGLLREYLTREIAPNVHRDAVNARFEVTDGRVSQFALPQAGEDMDIDASMVSVQQALASGSVFATAVAHKKYPAITDVERTEALGITSRLARGETDFKGSPKNRIHNITTGTARYHGVLIAPGQEFSFNEFLGPVTAQAGFKPELVIKNNKTTPEFGAPASAAETAAKASGR
jgi:hypothetical protein